MGREGIDLVGGKLSEAVDGRGKSLYLFALRRVAG